MLKIGFIGTGGFTRHHLSVLEHFKEVQVVGFVGSSKEKAEKFAYNYQGANGYSSLEKMIASEKIDAVIICVPPMAHRNYEEILIQHQIPFLVEKPLGVEEAAVRQVKRQVEKHDHLTSVGYHFRYADSVRKLQEKLKEMNIGLVSGKWMGSMPEVYWWKKQDQSGGQFNEQTTHIVDLVRFLFGEVTAVYAQEDNRIKQNLDPEVTVADAGVFILTLENGLNVQISNTSVLPDGADEVGITVYSDEGIIQWNPDYLHIRTPVKEESIPLEKNPYMTELEAFLHAVRTGDRSPIASSYPDAWKSFKVALAAQRSIQDKRKVYLDEIED